MGLGRLLKSFARKIRRVNFFVAAFVVVRKLYAADSSRQPV